MVKKVALLIPHHFNLYEEIIKNLEINKYEVSLLILTDKNFKYKNFAEKFLNFIHKTFLGNKDFKSKLRIKRHSEALEKALELCNDTYDYALVIRPDYFTRESLIKLKNKTKLFTSYQWDGFKRYPSVINYINICDRFFVFDKDDYLQYKQKYSNIFPITNFYIDFYSMQASLNDNIYFLGSYIENRMDEIISITNYFDSQAFPTDINIVYPHKGIPDKLQHSKINILKTGIKYAEMIRKIQSSKYLLEFQNTKIHNGLSFRVFEALCFNKKLITNNQDVKNYDFYHPNNILVWDNHDYSEILLFLKKNYVEIDPKVYKKYSFTNWIKYVFNEQPYQSINFPNI